MTDGDEGRSGTETLMGYPQVSFANLLKRVVSGEITEAPPVVPAKPPTDSLVNAQELAWFVANTDRTETQETRTETPRAKREVSAEVRARKRWPLAVAMVAAVTAVSCAVVYFVFGDAPATYTPAAKPAAAAPKSVAAAPKPAAVAKPAAAAPAVLAAPKPAPAVEREGGSCTVRVEADQAQAP